MNDRSTSPRRLARRWGRLVGAALAAFAGVAALGCRVPEGPALPDEDTGIRVCTSPSPSTSGAALSYYRFGHGDCGETREDVEIIAVHGANADGLVFARLASVLAPSERRALVAVDLPGHGRSEAIRPSRGQRATPTWLADELVPLIDWLAPDDRPRILLCHSLAGPVCVRLLEQAASAGLRAVLVNPTFPIEGGEVQLADSVRLAPQLLGLDWAADVIQGMPWPRDAALSDTARRVLVDRQRERIQASNYRVKGHTREGRLIDLGTPVERRREMFDDPDRRRLSRQLNNTVRRQGRLDAWIGEGYDARIQAVGDRLCVLLDPGDEVVDWRSTLARIEQLNGGSPGREGIGAYLFTSMQGDHSSITSIPTQVAARLRLEDPCARPGLGDPSDPLPAAAPDRQWADR